METCQGTGTRWKGFYGFTLPEPEKEIGQGKGEGLGIIYSKPQSLDSQTEIHAGRNIPTLSVV